MEFLQGFISFLEKFGVLRLFEPLKQKLDTLIMDAGFNPSTAATLSVTAIVLGIAIILVIILAICWLWLKFKLRRRRRKNRED